MRKSPRILFSRLLAIMAGALVLSGCSTAVVALKPIRPSPPQTLAAESKLRQAGLAFAEAGRIEETEPLAAVADYLSAAQSSSERLRSQPNDMDALRDYDFALSHVFLAIHNHNIATRRTTPK